jgi:hypothetical protein
MMFRPKPTEESKANGVDFAWRTHAAITDWTAKADAKATIVLSLGGVVLGFYVTLSGNKRALSHLHGWRHVIVWVGYSLTVLGIAAAARVVMPRLKRREAKRIWRDHFIYFGHLRRWDPKDLRKRLASLDEDTELEVLAQQLVTTSQISWFKHALLQWAIGLLLFGALFVSLSVVWPR